MIIAKSSFLFLNRSGTLRIFGLKENRSVAEGLYLLRFFSFTKADRILKRTEFLHLSRYGKKISNNHFIVLFCPGRFDRSRLGITASRKVGKAVKRNRIKRFAREYFRLHRHEIKGYWDINIIAKKEAAELTSEQAYLSLKDVFDRIGGS